MDDGMATQASGRWGWMRQLRRQTLRLVPTVLIVMLVQGMYHVVARPAVRPAASSTSVIPYQGCLAGASGAHRHPLHDL